MLRRSLVIAVVALAAAGIASAGNGDKEQIHFVAADQAAAKAAVLRASDLPAGWRGGAKKPDLSPGPSCANFKPKQSDLVLTGAAETDYSVPNDVRSISSEAQVLRTARMVQLDWRRTVLAPGLMSCLRSYLAKGAPKGSKIVSLAKLPFPKVATYTAAYRIVMEITANGAPVRFLVDEILVGAGRTELNLTSLDFVTNADAALALETRLARTLAARIPA